MDFSRGISHLWRKVYKQASGKPTAEQLVTLGALAQKCGKEDVEKSIELLRSCASGSGQTPIAEAVKILGSSQVVTHDEAIHCWWRDKPLEHPVVPWRSEYLRVLAKANLAKITNWWLVYLFGLPLTEQVRLRSSRDIKPYFREHTDPKYFTPEKLLKTPPPTESGYYLLDFSGLRRYAGHQWKVQEQGITSADEVRASNGLITEAVLTIGATKKIMPLSGFAHWGKRDRILEEPKGVMQCGEQLCFAIRPESDSKIPWGAVVMPRLTAL